MTGDAVERPEALEVERAPALLSATLSLFAAVVAVGAGALAAWQALPVGGAGTLLLAVGLVAGSRRAVTYGGVALFAGAAVAGTVGAPPELPLVAATAAVLAWDVGQNAIGVGDQLGRAAGTERGEVAHAAASTAVGVVTAGFGYVVYQLATGGQPVAALVFLLLGAVVLVSALRT